MQKLEIENITKASGDIEHDGSVVVKGNIEPQCRLIATGDIDIYGAIKTGSVISKKGSIRLLGEVVTSQIEGMGDIQLISGKNSTITSKKGNIIIQGNLDKCNVNAYESILSKNEDALVNGGNIIAGKIIDLPAVLLNDSTSLIIENYAQEDVLRKILYLDKMLTTKKEDYEKSKRAVELIKLLGNKIQTMPPEKKKEFVQQLTEFKNIKAELTKLLKVRQILQQKSEANKDEFSTYIMVHGFVDPGIKVEIFKSNITLRERMKHVIFIKKGIILIRDIDNVKKYM